MLEPQHEYPVTYASVSLRLTIPVSQNIRPSAVPSKGFPDDLRFPNRLAVCP